MRKKWEWQGPWNWGKTFPHVLPMSYYIHDKDEHNEYEAGELLRVEVHISLCNRKDYDHRWWGAEEMWNKKVTILDTDLVLEAYEFDTEKEALEFVRNWWKVQ